MMMTTDAAETATRTVISKRRRRGRRGMGNSVFAGTAVGTATLLRTNNNNGCNKKKTTTRNMITTFVFLLVLMICCHFFVETVECFVIPSVSITGNGMGVDVGAVPGSSVTRNTIKLNSNNDRIPTRERRRSRRYKRIENNFRFGRRTSMAALLNGENSYDDRIFNDKGIALLMEEDVDVDYDDQEQYRNNNKRRDDDDGDECKLMSDGEAKVSDSMQRDYTLLAEEFAESLDLSRETFRMDSLSSYVVVSVLVATASFSTIEALDNTVAAVTMDIRALRFLAINVSLLASLAGIYSTVIFALCAAYGRASIGRRNDRAYYQFLTNTEMLRIRGFKAFLASLGLFLAEVVIVSTERIEAELRIPFMIIFIFIASFIFQDWRTVYKAASPIFAEDEDDIGRAASDFTRFPTMKKTKVAMTPTSMSTARSQTKKMSTSYNNDGDDENEYDDDNNTKTKEQSKRNKITIEG